MIISIIVAINEVNAIGFQNALLYHMPSDLKRFKELTTGHTIIMGRKTFESLPKGALPNRRNVVISRNASAEYKNTECFTSLEKALENCKNEEEVFIIGGASIYNEAMNLADRLYITLIHDSQQEADTFFPPIDKEIWKIEKRDDHPSDDKHLFSYSFIDYSKSL